MLVDSEEDCLTSKDGRKILCHAGKFKKEDDKQGKQYYVKEIQTRMVKAIELGKIKIIAVVMFYHGTKVEWDQKTKEERSMSVNGIILEDWEGKYPNMFEENGQYGDNEILQKIIVRHREIAWKVDQENFRLPIQQ